MTSKSQDINKHTLINIYACSQVLRHGGNFNIPYEDPTYPIGSGAGEASFTHGLACSAAMTHFEAVSTWIGGRFGRFHDNHAGGLFLSHIIEKCLKIPNHGYCSYRHPGVIV